MLIHYIIGKLEGARAKGKGKEKKNSTPGGKPPLRAEALTET
jgi:hypothetical protein